MSQGKTILLFDVSNLCYRAWFTTGGLSHEGEATGVVFGVLREIELRIEMHNSPRVVFAFDYGGAGLRSDIYPEYKAHRHTKDMTEEEEASFKEFKLQVKKLYRKVLPDMGFKNVFVRRGYEADDIIAHYAALVEKPDDAIIVSTDNDLWQCLKQNVICFNPISKKVLTAAEFMNQWGIDPVQWATVKAAAGCSSDNVQGIRGVGDKTAAKWIRGELKAGSAKAQAIEDGIGIVSNNMKLVKLPYPGLELPDLIDDETSESKKDEVYASMGFRGRRPAAVKRGPIDV